MEWKIFCWSDWEGPSNNPNVTYLKADPKADELCDALKPLFSVLLRQTERSRVGYTAKVLVPVLC